MWPGMQLQHDLHAAEEVERPTIERFAA